MKEIARRASERGSSSGSPRECNIASLIGRLDPEAIARVRDEAWPKPENAEEAHEALLSSQLENPPTFAPSGRERAFTARSSS